MDIEDRLRSFIVEELGYSGDPSALDDDYPLIDNQVIDSLGIFQILSWLESELGVEIPDEDLVPDNFGSIGAITRLVRERQSA